MSNEAKPSLAHAAAPPRSQKTCSMPPAAGAPAERTADESLFSEIARVVGKKDLGWLEIWPTAPGGPTLYWRPESGNALGKIEQPLNTVKDHQWTKRDPANPKKTAKIRFLLKGSSDSFTFEFIGRNLDTDGQFELRDRFRNTLAPLLRPAARAPSPAPAVSSLVCKSLATAPEAAPAAPIKTRRASAPRAPARRRRAPRPEVERRRAEEEDERRRRLARRWADEQHARRLRTLTGARLRAYCKEQGVPVPARAAAGLADRDVTLDDLFGASSDDEAHKSTAPAAVGQFVATAGGADGDVAAEGLFEDVEQHVNERHYDSNSEEEF